MIFSIDKWMITGLPTFTWLIGAGCHGPRLWALYEQSSTHHKSSQNFSSSKTLPQLKTNTLKTKWTLVPQTIIVIRVWLIAFRRLSRWLQLVVQSGVTFCSIIWAESSPKEMRLCLTSLSQKCRGLCIVVWNVRIAGLWVIGLVGNLY